MSADPSRLGRSGNRDASTVARARRPLAEPAAAATPAAAPLVEAKDEYAEVMANIRHYSNLRFAIVGVFIAITGALIAALFGKEALVGPPEIGMALRVFGLITTATFWWIEFTLNGYLTAFGEAAKKLHPGSHWNQRPSLRRQLVPVATMSIHAMAAVFWVLSFRWQAG